MRRGGEGEGGRGEGCAVAIDALRSLRLCETIFKEKSWFEDGRPETEDRRPEAGDSGMRRGRDGAGERDVVRAVRI